MKTPPHAMLESTEAGAVSVWSTGGSKDFAHRGEMISAAVMQCGCTGAVVDGGLRDLDYVS